LSVNTRYTECDENQGAHPAAGKYRHTLEFYGHSTTACNVLDN